MVLEHLFPEDWLESKIRYAFIIAVVYSTLGIIISRFLFKANSGIVAVAFTSLFILPYLQKIFAKEEKEEESEKQYNVFSRKGFVSFFKNNQAIRVYWAIFLGIYLTFLLYSFMLPQFGIDTGVVFKEQLVGEAPLKGNADLSDVLDFEVGPTVNEVSDPLKWNPMMFLNIALNNWWVLLACFILSIMIGDGGIFFITWNASAWGTSLGFRALTAGLVSGESAWFFLLMVVLITLPYLILEGGAYILAAISGGIISDEIVKSRSDVRYFIAYLLLGGGLLWCISFFLRNFINISAVWVGISNILIVLAMIYVIGHLFEEKSLKKVFKNNYLLFLLAVILFLVGAYVESLILKNSSMLQQIYRFSMMYLM